MHLRRMLTCLSFALCVAPIAAQWEIQDAHTTANLRGIHYVGNGLAWASGSEGTVLRTEDMGFVWQLCTVPPGAEKLDFRGIQAFDNNTAIVMSSGKGDLSRLYKTTDGCQTWKLVFTNPDKDGFWDALSIQGGEGLLIGDPVDGRFQIYSSSDTPHEHWARFREESSFRTFRFDLSAYAGEALFAASNSILRGMPSRGLAFAGGGPLGAKFSFAAWVAHGSAGFPQYESYKSAIPLAVGNTAGAFSVGYSDDDLNLRGHLLAVGGSYSAPAERDGTAAWSLDFGKHWHASKHNPMGYRSAVAYVRSQRTWITVGPNGTDISTDDGRNWHPLKPGPGDAPDADQHWNALSLPFVVGPKGRIGLLHEDALKTPASSKP